MTNTTAARDDRLATLVKAAGRRVWCLRNGHTPRVTCWRGRVVDGEQVITARVDECTYCRGRQAWTTKAGTVDPTLVPRGWSWAHL
jgi:hypothetical protein